MSIATWLGLALLVPVLFASAYKVGNLAAESGSFFEAGVYTPLFFILMMGGCVLLIAVIVGPAIASQYGMWG